MMAAIEDMHPCNDPDPDSPLGPTLDPLETYD